jgi:hypothetical protein
MSEFKVKKYTILCRRFAAECRDLAGDVPEQDLRARFLRIADRWIELADQPRVLN